LLLFFFIVSLFFQLFVSLYSLLQNTKMQFGLVFIQKSGQSPPPSQWIRVPSNDYENLLNQGAVKSLLPWQDRPPPRRRPDRHYGCIWAIRHVWQDD
jgi:hypothetical protein